MRYNNNIIPKKKQHLLPRSWAHPWTPHSCQSRSTVWRCYCSRTWDDRRTPRRQWSPFYRRRTNDFRWCRRWRVWLKIEEKNLVKKVDNKCIFLSFNRFGHMKRSVSSPYLVLIFHDSMIGTFAEQFNTFWHIIRRRNKYSRPNRFFRLLWSVNQKINH